MKKILFLIPNLKHGGAEKVLVNLVNNLDPSKYDITVQTLFDVGVHKASLKGHIHYCPCFPFEFRGNSLLFQLFSPQFWWNRLIKGHYDIAVSYLEGPTTRILSGCTDKSTKRVAWVHTEVTSEQLAALGFRSIKEARHCYAQFDNVVAVSKQIQSSLLTQIPDLHQTIVLYNTNETELIIQSSLVSPSDPHLLSSTIPIICSVGKLTKVKGFDRLLNVHKRLLDEEILHRIYILGIGEEQAHLEQQIMELGISDTVTLLGFQKNPYQYVSRCDLYVCSSHREGFSTAVTESLIVGTPVVSTNCSGAKELLGEHDEYGIVVENSEEGIYQGLKKMLSDPVLLSYYKKQAALRGTYFSCSKTVKAVEDMLDHL